MRGDEQCESWLAIEQQLRCACAHVSQSTQAAGLTEVDDDHEARIDSSDLMENFALHCLIGLR